ncbi:MAG: hypothetical protein AAF386_00090 [Pseudomonadota bacterium]
MKQLSRSQVTIYGTQVFLDWIKTVQPHLHRWDLAMLNNRPSAYLIDQEDQNCHGLSLQTHFKAIVEQELSQHFYIPRKDWPENITLDLFQEWFWFQYHEEIYDLSAKNLEVYDG